jgi:hypothetical protein
MAAFAGIDLSGYVPSASADDACSETESDDEKLGTNWMYKMLLTCPVPIAREACLKSVWRRCACALT